MRSAVELFGVIDQAIKNLGDAQDLVVYSSDSEESVLIREYIETNYPEIHFKIEMQPENLNLPINFFNQMGLDKKQRERFLAGYYDGSPQAKIIDALTDHLLPEQMLVYYAGLQLFSYTARGLGRTTALITAGFVLAVQNPGEGILIADHWAGADQRYFLGMVHGVLSTLPVEYRRGFSIKTIDRGNGQVIAIHWRPEPSEIGYKP